MSTPSDWVDFKAVKAHIDFPMILRHYGIDWLKHSGDRLRGRCPLGLHPSSHGDQARDFHISLSKRAFKCFHPNCHQGNILDFVAAMEKVSVREAALKLQQWFSLKEGSGPTQESHAPPGTEQKKIAQVDVREDGSSVEGVINPPLGFRLRVDPEHNYGPSRGLSKAIISEFGCGLCLSRGSFSGRYVIPVFDEKNNLVAYAGRSLEDATEPKYLFPPSDKRFFKSRLLYNLNRVLAQEPQPEEVIVVEGFFDCMKVTGAGFPCVAVMGWSVSEEQAVLLAKYFRRVQLMLDADPAGQEGTEAAVLRLSRRLFVKVISLPEGKQPDELSAEQLRFLLEERK